MTAGTPPRALAERLAAVVGPDHVLTDPALTAAGVRSADELAAMTAVKQALDPGGRLGRALLPFDGARRPA